MGLLDDAIREHLELKRRRGADSSEVARQEQEAFGPPRRGDLVPDEHPSAHDAPRALQAVEEPMWDHEDEDVAAEEEPATRVLSHVEPVEPAPVEEEPAISAAPEPEVETPAEEPGRGSLAEESGQPTREFDAHELRAATEAPSSAPAPAEPVPQEDGEEGEDGDVLEATPEFLQETPEHDRLWFEQRPPRDFDF